jgi:2-amino-4-ketopentanoate thiolase alpha subunit
MSAVAKGTWVQVEQVVLDPSQRAPSLPEDTRRVPYMLQVSGFLLENASLGEDARVRTLIGRELGGRLTTVNPSYAHSFGETIPELLDIGLDHGRRHDEA